MKPILLTITMCLAAAGGCVEREMTITSDPGGALVFVSEREVGRTPLTMSFLWYGDYEIRLSREGYETLNTHRNIREPWYETIPLDFFSAIAPWTYHDRRYLHFTLEEAQQVSNDELKRRADELRLRNDQPVEK